MRVLSLSILLLLALTTHAQSLDRLVAVVNNDVITANELQTEMTAFRQQLVAKRAPMPSEKLLRKQVLQHMIDDALQLQLAKNNNLIVDDSELNQAIIKIAASNKMNLIQFKQAVKNQGLIWNNYKENVRKEILMSKLQQKALNQEITVSPQQIDNYLKTVLRDKKKLQQAYHLEHMIIPLPEQPSKEQIRWAYQKAQSLLIKIKNGYDFNKLAVSESNPTDVIENGDLGFRYLSELPEVFAQKVIAMSVGEVVGPIRTGNGFQLIKLVGVSGGDEKHMVTKTHVRHILLKQVSSATSDETKKQVDAIYQQVKQGKNFSLIAKKYSADIASAEKGGDLGWVTNEELVQPFAEVMDKLPLHVISKPVKTIFGWHIIEVMARKTVDDTQAFQKQQAKQILYQQKFAEAVQSWLQHLRADAYIKIFDKSLA
ncbi:MAG: peptidylprolyl isomerase [Legionella sp.]